METIIKESNYKNYKEYYKVLNKLEELNINFLVISESPDVILIQDKISFSELIKVFKSSNIDLILDEFYNNSLIIEVINEEVLIFDHNKKYYFNTNNNLFYDNINKLPMGRNVKPIFNIKHTLELCYSSKRNECRGLINLFRSIISEGIINSDLIVSIEDNLRYSNKKITEKLKYFYNLKYTKYKLTISKRVYDSLIKDNLFPKKYIFWENTNTNKVGIYSTYIDYLNGDLVNDIRRYCPTIKLNSEIEFYESCTEINIVDIGRNRGFTGSKLLNFNFSDKYKVLFYGDTDNKVLLPFKVIDPNKDIKLSVNLTELKRLKLGNSLIFNKVDDINDHETLKRIYNLLNNYGFLNKIYTYKGNNLGYFKNFYNQVKIQPSKNP